MSEWPLRDYLTEAVLPGGSQYVGKELAEITNGLGLRVIGLIREGHGMPAVPTYRLVGDERLIIEGKREDILRVKDLQGIDIRPAVRLADAELSSRDALLVEASVPPGSPLVGRSLKEVLFVERSGLVAFLVFVVPAVWPFQTEGHAVPAQRAPMSLNVPERGR